MLFVMFVITKSSRSLQTHANSSNYSARLCYNLHTDIILYSEKRKHLMIFAARFVFSYQPAKRITCYFYQIMRRLG